MAKITDSASPRALSRVLSERQLTRQELAAKASVDRKTLQKIDEGQPVKRETLVKVADALRVPVDWRNFDDEKTDGSRSRQLRSCSLFERMEEERQRKAQAKAEANKPKKVTLPRLKFLDEK